MRKLTDSGQGTLEAAFTIPVLFLVMLLLLQPGIVLYDRTVMNAAAAEGCRVLATKNAAAGSMDGVCETYVRHRLASVPQHDCFHVHKGNCSWDIALSGDGSSDRVSVRIKTELKPLPLFDGASKVLGLSNAQGNWELTVESSAQVQPDWVGASPAGQDPSGWIGAWQSEE